MKCAIYTIGRLENDYIREWCEYHLNLGFDKIYLFDNNYDGEEYFEDVIQDLIDNKKVQMINVRNMFDFQKISYNMALSNFADKFDWNVFIDIDEFITLVNAKNIKDYLNNDIFKDFDMIHINWMTYGDSGHIIKTNDNVIKRFTIPIMPLDKHISYDFPENNHVKSIIRGNCKDLKELKFLWNPHTPSNILVNCCNNKGEKVNSASPFCEYNFDEAYIRHYTSKSLEEFLSNKLKKGFCEGHLPQLNLDWFWKRNEKTEEKERFINDYLKKIKND